jgi:hypothetical protein
MADNDAIPARRLRPVRKVVLHSDRSRPHSGRNAVNVALPFSSITAEAPAKIRERDWVSVAGLMTSIIGFSVVIRQLIRIARASEARQAIDRANRNEPDSRASRPRPDPPRDQPLSPRLREDPR